MTMQPVTTTPTPLSELPSPASNRLANRVGPRLPRSQRWTKRGLVLTAIAIALFLIFAGRVSYYLLGSVYHPHRTDLVTQKIRYDRLELTIVERGGLESGKNSDIFCRVKAGTKNSTVATTIKNVIDDGSQVKKGDLVVELDDSGLIEQLKGQKITLDKAESDKIQAEESLKIQRSQNQSDIENARSALKLAKIDLEKYVEGDFPQALKDVDGRISIAESDLDLQRDRSAWANRMVKKGYQTANQAEAEESKLKSYDLALKKVREEKRVLTDPNYGLKKRTETDFISKLREAERSLTRIQSQAVAKEVQAKTDREAKKSIYEQERTHYQEIQDEIKKCKIYAPQEGMVIYYIPDQARFGGGSQQSIVAQGEPVREGQKLLQIPDLRHMVVNTKIHEALISHVHQGQPAAIRVDSFPDRLLRGHVDLVATVSSQQDWLSADVKVYATRVLIDNADTVLTGDETLKPGMSAQVIITIGDPLEKVLTVPIQAIVGSAEMGAIRDCFVLGPEGPEERKILIGASNDKIAEIKPIKDAETALEKSGATVEELSKMKIGIKEGEEVVLNPRAIVGDKAKTRQAGGDNSKDAGEGGTRSTKSPQIESSQGAAPSNKSGPSGSPQAGQERSQAAPGQASQSVPGGPSKRNQEAGGEASQQAQDMLKRFKAASPEERKQMLQQVPKEFRDRAKQRLKAQGIEIPE